MNDLTVINPHLPDTIQDLAKFVLVGREKLVAVRAEIRAIDKLNIAEEVRQQKRDEAQMLSEALLDAEVRIGELLKAIPTAGGGDRKSHDFKNNTAVKFEKPKLEVVKDLGFTPMQTSRFETLAANKDIVDQVKAEARENEDIPTRSRVLQLVQEKNRKPIDSIDFKFKAAREIKEALAKISLIEASPNKLQCFIETVEPDERDYHLSQVNDGIRNLAAIKSILLKGGI